MGLVAIGTVAWDTIETPFEKADLILGGSGLHFTAAASYFSPVSLAAVVGDDFSLSELDFLKRRKTDLSGLSVVPGKTFHWWGRYGYDMNTRETIRTELGVIADYSPQIPLSLQNPDHLFLGNIHPKLQLKILNEIGKPGKISLDTMNLWIREDPETLSQVLSRVDLVVINEEEARQLTGELSLLKAAKKIHSLGPQAVVIKRGEYGALAFYKGELFSAPGLPLEQVKDPTGAGDSFAGGLLGFLARKKGFDWESLKKGVIVGSAMASFNVEDFGCERLKNLKEEEIKGRVAEFTKLAQFGEIHW